MCPYFEVSGMARCGAVEGWLTPSLHERERFCLGDPERCRTLAARRVLGEPIPLRLYDALWLAPEGGQPTGADAAPTP